MSQVASDVRSAVGTADARRLPFPVALSFVAKRAGYDRVAGHLTFQRGQSRAEGDGAEGDGAGGDDGAYGLQASYRSKQWSLSLTENHVEEDFSPELGFVRRTGVREHRLSVERTWHVNGPIVRRWTSRFMPRVTTNENGSKDSWIAFIRPIEVTFASDDKIEYDIRREFWRLPGGFDIHDGITIPAGDYQFTTHSFEFKTAEKRWVYLESEVRFGGF